MESRDAVYDTVCIVTEIVHGSTLCKLDMKAHCGSSSCRMFMAMEGQGWSSKLTKTLTVDFISHCC